MTTPQDVKPPAQCLARIILSDGQEISQQTIQKKPITTSDSVRIFRNTKGFIKYSGVKDFQGHAVRHTLVNPEGSTMALLQLSDDTQIWINPGSSIEYPVLFQPADRSVKVNGEVYLKIKSNNQDAFIIRLSENKVVRTNGSRLSVRNHADEEDDVVAMDMGVAILQHGADQISIPPKQLVIGKELIEDPDDTIFAYLAWRIGNFYFAGTPVQMVMRDLERWYGIKIDYRSPHSRRTYNGVTKRDRTLSEVLDKYSLGRYTLEVNETTVVLTDTSQRGY